MDNQELTSILKQDGGLGAVCKRLIAEGPNGISENAFVSAVTKHARERFADLPADVAFSKLYEGDVMLRKTPRCEGRRLGLRERGVTKEFSRRVTSAACRGNAAGP